MLSITYNIYYTRVYSMAMEKMRAQESIAGTHAYARELCNARAPESFAGNYSDIVM